jgi:hypothetical protein
LIAKHIIALRKGPKDIEATGKGGHEHPILSILTLVVNKFIVTGHMRLLSIFVRTSFRQKALAIRCWQI